MIHHESHFLHRLHIKNSKKTHIILSLTLRDFAAGMMAVFVPIYLLTIGFTIIEAALFNVGVFVLATISMWPVMRYIRHFGVNHALALSYIFTAFYTLGLFISQYSLAGLLIAGVFGALTNSIYWTSQWVDLSRIFNAKHMGQSISNLQSLRILATAIAPLAGGLIAEAAGPSYALLSSFGVFVLAIFVIQKELRTERQSPTEYKLLVPKKSVIRDSISNVGMSFQSTVSGSFWPLYIWLLHDTFSGIGFMFTVSGFLGVLVLSKSGKMDDVNKHDLYKFSVITRSLTHILRPIVSSIRSLFVVELIAAVTFALYHTTFASRYMKHAQQAGAEKYIFYFETIGKLGVVLAWGLLALLLIQFDDVAAIRIMFLLAIPMTLIAGLISKPLQKS